MNNSIKKTVLISLMIIVLSNLVLADYVKVFSVKWGEHPQNTMMITDFTDEKIIIYNDGRWSYPVDRASGIGYNIKWYSSINQDYFSGVWEICEGWSIYYKVNADTSADGNYDYITQHNPYPKFNELDYNQNNWKITCTEQYTSGIGECSGYPCSYIPCHGFDPGSCDPWFQDCSGWPWFTPSPPQKIVPCYRVATRLNSAGPDYVDFNLEDVGGWESWGRSAYAIEIGYERVCTLNHHTGCVGNQRWRFDSCNNAYELIETCSGSCQANYCCVCTPGTCCSNGCDYDARGTSCSDTDNCVGETWYTGYTCNSAGSCINPFGPQDKDTDESYCTSTATSCTPRNWASGGEVAQTNCCGDDTGEYYDGAESCDGTHACCNSASDVVQDGNCVSNCLELHWENLFEDEITGTNEEDTVRMVLRNTYLPEDSEVQFEIYEGSDAIRTGTDAITGTVEEGVVVANWTITQEDLDKTTSLNNFQFTTSFSEKTSNNLRILTSHNNSPTSVNIISPTCGSYFNVGPNAVNIIVNVEDEDDFVEGTLTINNLQIATFRNGNTINNYAFSSSGNYKIVAETIDSRGQRARAISNVMVIDPAVDGEYVAACITKPEDYSNIPTNYIEFDASDSLGISYSTATGVATEINPSRLSFDWSFSDGRTNPYHLGTNELSYHFFKNFDTVGNNWATLQVSTV